MYVNISRYKVLLDSISKLLNSAKDMPFMMV